MSENDKKDLAERIKNYVRLEASCTPGEPELIYEADGLHVYKVPVEQYNKDWEVRPPEFWYVVPEGAMNLYPSDLISELRGDAGDCILNMHLGLMSRMSFKGKLECAECGKKEPKEEDNKELVDVTKDLKDIAEWERGRRAITEEEGEHKKWYEEAETQTRSSLLAFIGHLLDDYIHDYGTICHAAAAAAIAAAHSIDRDKDQGGFTGFQASTIQSMFILHWTHPIGPLRLQHFQNMLYPQHKDEFVSISEKVWTYLRCEADRMLSSNVKACAEVKQHWQNIVEGAVPFGYTVRND